MSLKSLILENPPRCEDPASLNIEVLLELRSFLLQQLHKAKQLI